VPVPSPKLPAESVPQQCSALDELMPHAEFSDKEICAQGGAIAAGANLEPAAVPSPHWPFVLAPQQFPPDTAAGGGLGGAGGADTSLIEPGAAPGTPQVANADMARELQVNVDATRVGTDLVAMLASPSCPALLYPQQKRSPPALMPHVRLVDAATTAQLAEEPTWAGELRAVAVPSPSWEYAL